MVNDSMQSNKLIGMVQPNINKKLSNKIQYAIALGSNLGNYLNILKKTM